MANFEEYDIGDAVRIKTTFTVDDVPTDPTTVTLYVKDPAGATVEHAEGTLTNPSVGVWYKDVAVNQAGTYGAKMTGVGVVDSVAQTTFQVRRSVT